MHGSDNPPVLPREEHPLPRITLRPLAGLLAVEPAADSPSNKVGAFEPFVLPPIPDCIVEFASTLGDLQFHRHRRCLAVLLLLETTRAQWVARLPRQVCGRTGSCWSTSEDLGIHSTEVLAGTFQVRTDLGPDEVLHAVPPIDGVHLVQVPHPDQPRGLWSFLRVGGEVRPVVLSDVSFDENETALAAAMPRLTLL